ncbi:hypothetical protein [Actinoplanes sp. L3-i22]|uniref:hypothetical protein n=1 Tax=Actinoplanes sp. L3-i22 TaxID=2836373 RepID=UPI001C777987|nr:hypothetical protein [Actinoplanes sp. L3-i22]BCY09480.1 hypothetical protein L3i22_045680 [Actinoplanes sp. L3-i22]
MNRKRILLLESFPRRLLALLVAVLAAVAITPSAAHAAVPNNYIFNNSSVGIGVWHDYHSGTYDGVLSAYSKTKDQWGWDHASKFYVGSGYCFTAYRKTAGSTTAAWDIAVAGVGPVTYPGAGDYNSSWWNYDWQIHLFRVVNGACGPRV